MARNGMAPPRTRSHATPAMRTREAANPSLSASRHRRSTASAITRPRSAEKLPINAREALAMRN
eukprot:6999360-Lingulodinium_polyedra.AAC.1